MPSLWSMDPLQQGIWAQSKHKSLTTWKMELSSTATRGARCTAAWSDTHLCSHTAGLCTCAALSQ